VNRLEKWHGHVTRDFHGKAARATSNRNQHETRWFGDWILNEGCGLTGNQGLIGFRLRWTAI